MAKINHFGYTYSEMAEKERKVIKAHKTKDSGPLCFSCIPIQKPDL